MGKAVVFLYAYLCSPATCSNFLLILYKPCATRTCELLAGHSPYKPSGVPGGICAASSSLKFLLALSLLSFFFDFPQTWIFFFHCQGLFLTEGYIWLCVTARVIKKQDQNKQLSFVLLGCCPHCNGILFCIFRRQETNSCNAITENCATTQIFW